MISAAPAGPVANSIVGARPRLHWLLLTLPLLIAAFCLDHAIAEGVRTNSTRTLRDLAGAVSRFGDWPPLAVGGIIFLILARLRKDRRVARLISIMLVASALAGLTANIVRGLTGRGRPRAPIEMQGWHGPHDGKQWLVGKSKRNSFPSAHTAAATAFFTPLCFGFARRAGVVKLGILLAVLSPALIGASRILLNAHFISDVLAGAWVGLCAVFLTLNLRTIWRFRRWTHRATAWIGARWRKRLPQPWRLQPSKRPA
jgi:membrane-associated phospholipid phosphatase